MRLAVFSHKICWAAQDAPCGYVTDGGFPLQMRAISELFAETTLVVPCDQKAGQTGVIALTGNNLKVSPLSVPRGKGLRRKARIFGWAIKNFGRLWREARRADAIHAPIPGDVGTIGMLLAVALGKPLFVRHCGNWFEPRTAAERFWRWSMERLAGGRNVMLATGGASEPPSPKNPNVKWIFSTSLNEQQLETASTRVAANRLRPRLLIACRQEPRKGSDVVIESLPLILEKFPAATLDVVGDGSLLPRLRALIAESGLNEKVVLHGKVEHSQVLELMRNADLFCYPTTASEGFPKVVLEALACGLPVVTTKVSVLPKLLESGCGKLLDCAEPRAVAAAVVEICSDANLYQQMSSKAIETARAYALEGWQKQIRETLCEAWNVTTLA